MHSARIWVAVLVGATTLGVAAAGQGQKKKEEVKKPAAPASANSQDAARAPASREADDAAIRSAVAAFGKAYNAHDAKAAAALFGPDAKIVVEDDNVVEGREEIEQLFAEIFADEPQSQIEVNIASIKFLGSDLAIETGSTKTTAAPGETPEYGRYTVLHVKRDGKWLIGLARDTEGEPPTNHERLQPLAWLIGEWIDESRDSVVASSCRWSEDKNYILYDAKVHIGGMRAMEVTVRIGWDPLTKQIKSWMFDTEGGYGDGMWSRDGDRWIVKATSVLPDGSTASATNIYTPLGNERFLWQSTDRVVSGEVRDPVDVMVVRKPPQPK